MKNFDFDTSKNIFLQPCIYYMATERLQGEKQFHYKNYLLEMARFHNKMRLKSAPQKLNFLMAKPISKRSTLGCGCKCPSHIVTHSNTVSFSIKTILCENSNIPFSKNY